LIGITPLGMTLAFGVANDSNHLMTTFNKATAGDFNH
jgi:hypothetical protein